MRADLDLICNWVPENSHVLDLGCGDGTLLHELKTRHGVNGYGVEIDSQSVLACLERGVNVIQSDLDDGLANFDDKSFDIVVMTQSLQTVHYPDQLIQEMLRVGKEAIISFPNMGLWRARLQLLSGEMPKTKALPHRWYNTPNIHLCTVRDFEVLCAQLDIEIIERSVVDTAHQSSILKDRLPNLFAELAIYRFKQRA